MFGLKNIKKKKKKRGGEREGRGGGPKKRLAQGLVSEGGETTSKKKRIGPSKKTPTDSDRTNLTEGREKRGGTEGNARFKWGGQRTTKTSLPEKRNIA